MAPPATEKWIGKVYNASDIDQMARFGGWREEKDLDTAVAVALAESGGRCDAKGGPNSDGSYDYGLWQINEKAHPEKFVGKDWSNPATNAGMAFKVWQEAGGKWTPWSAYNNGAYEKFMNARDEGSSSPIEDATDAVVDPVVGVASTIGAIGGLIYKAGAWLGDSDNWIRVAQVIVGGGLTIAAMTVIAKPTVSKFAGPVASVLTKGKAPA